MTSSTVAAEWPDAAIVVIDDEQPVRRMLAQVLAASGYTQVHDFADPREALERIPELAVELVILDLHMPELDGFSVLRDLTLGPAVARPAVVVMTGAAHDEDARRTLSVGAADFLRKPVDTTELLLRVRHQLRERRLRRDLVEHNERLEELVEERAGELALFSRVLDEMPIAAAVLDDGLRMRHANRRAKRLFAASTSDPVLALSAEAQRREGLARFLSEVDADQPRRFRSTIADGFGPRRVEIEAQRVSGDYIAVLIHDVEDFEIGKDALRRALEREQVANEKMREIEQLRTNFLSAVSHELRTPLTVVLGMAESLLRYDEQLDGDGRADILDRLHTNARRLGRLLEDLLDLNRLSVGYVTVDAAAHDVARVVEDALREIDVVDHLVDVDLESVEVRMDPRQIRRAVANLVRNATVHTPEGTHIEVRSEVAEDLVRVKVVDDGPGVPDELKQRIFAPFEQGPSVRRHRPGTGIGLSLVAEFVRLHDGSVWVEDTPGGGATFVIELPRQSEV